MDEQREMDIAVCTGLIQDAQKHLDACIMRVLQYKREEGGMPFDSLCMAADDAAQELRDLLNQFSALGGDED